MSRVVVVLTEQDLFCGNPIDGPLKVIFGADMSLASPACLSDPHLAAAAKYIQ